MLYLNRIEVIKFMIPMTFKAKTSFSMDDLTSLNYVYSITLVLMSELSNSSLEIGGPVLGVQWLRAVSANSIRAHNGLDNSDSSRDKLPPSLGAAHFAEQNKHQSDQSSLTRNTGRLQEWWILIWTSTKHIFRICWEKLLDTQYLSFKRAIY